MKKLGSAILIILTGIILAAAYGIIHDQLTFSISAEYYTKFKFIQFQLVEPHSQMQPTNPRLAVGLVGILATWWMGLLIGGILALLGFLHKTARRMYMISLKAMVLTIISAFVVGLIGLVYGKLYLADRKVSWWLPDDLIDEANFIAVGSMHNFSYIGGIIGLIIAALYSIRRVNS